MTEWAKLGVMHRLEGKRTRVLKKTQPQLAGRETNTVESKRLCVISVFNNLFKK